MRRFCHVGWTLGLVNLFGVCALAWIIDLAPPQENNNNYHAEVAKQPPWLQDVVVIKVGGSSITNKAIHESLNETALDWFSEMLAAQMHKVFTNVAPSNSSTCQATCDSKSAFVVIHGAGSFGHHTAKEFGLQGQFTPPLTSSMNETLQNRQMQGLAETRLSVRTLNHHVVSSLIKHGIHAVGISPCFSVPGMQAHGGSYETIQLLQTLVYTILQAGLIPVLHGDACLHGAHGAGILSGDTLTEMLAKSVPWVTRTIFLTDVDGVYASDPRTNPNAALIRTIAVNGESGLAVSIDLDASGSSHDHDVTGGLKTKLASAVAIAASGVNVTIARCGSVSAARVIRKDSVNVNATILFRTMSET